MTDTIAPLTDEQKAYARTATRLKVATSVWKLFDRLRRENGWTQERLAKRLGKNKSQISRMLNGPGNWTLDTVADLLEAMDAKIVDIEVQPISEIAARHRSANPLSAPGLDAKWNGPVATQHPRVSVQRRDVHWNCEAA